jgi:hypothetical protein
MPPTSSCTSCLHLAHRLCYGWQRPRLQGLLQHLQHLPHVPSEPHAQHAPHLAHLLRVAMRQLAQLQPLLCLS